MQLLKTLVLLSSFAISLGAEELESLTTKIIPELFGEFETKAGKDGRAVVFPKLWETKEGKDGRVVAYPKGWKSEEGKDGRVVGFPGVGWITEEGKDGRKVARPLGWLTEEGGDGRKVARPLGWLTEEGGDGRKAARPLGTKSVVGKDGRSVSFPGEELLFAETEFLASLETIKQEMKLKEWFDLALNAYINHGDRSLPVQAVENMDAFLKALNGASIYSQETPRKYLGKIASKYDSDSIFDKYGDYGSKYASDSIWDRYGSYGGERGGNSPFNRRTTSPPTIVSGGRVLGFLTANPSIRGGLDVETVRRLLEISKRPKEVPTPP